MDWLLTLSPLIALTINVIVQMLSVHFTSKIKFSIVCGFIAAVSADFILLFFINTFYITDALISFFSTFALSFCYFAFLNLNLTSLRIRIARELLNSGLSTEDLLQRYSPQELIARRIARLHDSKQIILKEGKWVLRSRKLLLLEYVFSTLRRWIVC